MILNKQLHNGAGSESLLAWLPRHEEPMRHGKEPSLFRPFSGRRPESATSPVENLTGREFKVFQWIGQGIETKDLARQRHVNPKTIEVHRANIKTKLKIKSMAELIRYAVRRVESEKRG